MMLRREITIAVIEHAEGEEIAVEVLVPEGMSTLEAVGLMETAKIQHLQSRHTQGPTIYQAPDSP